jgi:PAS domain S-box-containing protein
MWQSLRLRAPLALSALIAAVLAAFLWVAFREVEHALVESGSARAQVAADQLANLLAQSAQQRVRELQRAAADPVVRAYVKDPATGDGDRVRAQLVAIAAAAQPAIELWNAAGQRVLVVNPPASTSGTPTARLPALPATIAPAASGLLPLEVADGVVYWTAIADVRDVNKAGVGAASGDGARVGFIVSRRVLLAGTAYDALNRLVGRGASFAMGNRTGAVWTNLQTIVPPPPIDRSRPAAAEYRGSDGIPRLGANAPIAGTPWAVSVDFPRALVVAPAYVFLARMLLIGVGFVLAAALIVRFLTARVTTPLRDLTDAAERVAAGQHPVRVAASRRDEIGRLGAAFNDMASQVAGVQRDLEARVDARVAELRETREELDRFFSLSLDLLCIAEGPYLKRVNPAWQSVLGWTMEELTARPYLDFVHPDDLPEAHERAVQLADGNGGHAISFENRYRHRDGSYRWLQWKAAPTPQGIIYATARDVTDQKGSAQALEQYADEVSAANHELEAFSYSVSHDLRAPLRHVTGFAALLQREAGETLSEQGRRYLHTIVDAATRMGRLIDDLLAFSRVGRSPVVARRIDLGDLARDVQREIAAEANGRQIAWTLQPLPCAEGDPALLRLVFVNLLSNAVKYTSTRERAEIEVGAASAKGEAVVFVRDNGVGFDPQYAHKLFGVFQRLHSAEEFDGTGIGLANVRRIVQRHGGRTWAEGAIDRGATFYFSLPTSDSSLSTKETRS